MLDGDLVAVPAPAYPVYERGAAFAGKGVLELPLRAEAGFLPDLDAVPADTWARVSLLWLNYPNNPTAASAPLALYEQAAALAREHGFVLASDEAYSEIYVGEAPRLGARAPRPHQRRRAQHALQALLDAGLPLGLRGRRPRRDRRAQALPPQRRRRAAGVRPARRGRGVGRRGARRGRAGALPRAREVLLPALEARGLRHAGGDATFFLWLDGGAGAEATAAEWLERGIIVAPGSFFGPAGEGFLRLALVPPLEECERAAALL